jgi:hypothetical protein
MNTNLRNAADTQVLDAESLFEMRESDSGESRDPGLTLGEPPILSDEERVIRHRRM